MGGSYWFECPKCSYRVKVSGRPDRGVNVFVETIHCRDCRELHDVVTRMRVADGAPKPLRARSWAGRLQNHKSVALSSAVSGPPTFLAALGRLTYGGFTTYRWLEFKRQCPVSPRHSVVVWSDPGQCPKCGIFLERNAVPYRIWD